MKKRSCRPTLFVAVLFLIATGLACASLAPTAAMTSAPVPGPTATGLPAPTLLPTAAPAQTGQRVTFTSDGLSLEGYLYKPAGDGPFPGIIWNHGSEDSSDQISEFEAVAQIFVPAGYVVFAPAGRGQGGSQGQSIQDQVQQEQSSNGAAAAQKLFVQQMEGPQLDDQLAGLAYLKSLPYVDTARLAAAGCSYGAIQTMLAAGKGTDYKAAVAISPGSDSWDGNTLLQQDLTKAVSGINIPVFLIHPEKDVSVAPGYALAQEFLRLGKAYSLKIYPPFGPADEQGLCFGGAPGFHWWASDVVSFLGRALSPGAAAKLPIPRFRAQQITLQSDGLNLVGYIYKPDGPGPFPGIIWNHGSEPDPTDQNEFDAIASIFVPAGYVVVDPVRRGQGGSQGDYIVDQTKQVFQTKGKVAAEEFVPDQMAGPQLDDQLSGLAYLESLPYVDRSRLAVVGCSYGGMQTLFGAASGKGYKAAVALSPGAESWDGNPILQQALIKLISSISIPTFIIHPAQDASLAPGFALGPQFQQLGKTYGLEIFPPFGSALQHCFGGGAPGEGIHLWGPEALWFLSNVLH
ncbi:MAG TPA: prolyl oligopeptidase family serine peptidase [Anaerolineales bacterium]|nr:prolyl oligopeptidase family serine peptidase [Anaerolineales bacterium]